MRIECRAYDISFGGLCLGHATNPAVRIDRRTYDISFGGLCLGHATNPAVRIDRRTYDISFGGLCLGHATNPAVRIVCRTSDISLEGLMQSLCRKLCAICPASILQLQSVGYSYFRPVKDLCVCVSVTYPTSLSRYV